MLHQSKQKILQSIHILDHMYITFLGFLILFILEITEGPPVGLNKKQRRQLAYIEQSLSPDLHPVTSTLSSKPSGLDLENRVTPSHNPFDITEEMYKDMVNKHRKRRMNGEVNITV